MSDNFETFIDGGIGPNRKLTFDKLNDIMEKLDRLEPFLQSAFTEQSFKHQERPLPILCFAQEAKNKADGGLRLFDWYEAFYVGSGLALQQVPPNWNGQLNTIRAYGGAFGNEENKMQAILLSDVGGFGAVDELAGVARKQRTLNPNTNMQFKPSQILESPTAITGLTNKEGDEDEEQASPLYVFNVQQIQTANGSRQHVLVSAAVPEGGTCFEITSDSVSSSFISLLDEEGDAFELEVWTYSCRRFPRRDGDEAVNVYDVSYDKFCDNTPTGIDDASYEYKPYDKSTLITAVYDDRIEGLLLTAPIGNASISCNPENPKECGLG